MIQNLNHSFYQEDPAYVHDVGHGEHAKHAAAFLLEQLKSLKVSKGLIVDLGCGSGILASAMSKRGCHWGRVFKSPHRHRPEESPQGQVCRHFSLRL